MDSPYAFLNEHSRAYVDGVLAATCRTDSETWPCTVIRAFLAGRRSGYLIAADRLDMEADEGRRKIARRVAADLLADGRQIDEQLRAGAAC